MSPKRRACGPGGRGPLRPRTPVAFDLRQEPGAGKAARRDLWGRCRVTGTSTRPNLARRWRWYAPDEAGGEATDRLAWGVSPPKDGRHAAPASLLRRGDPMLRTALSPTHVAARSGAADRRHSGTGPAHGDQHFAHQRALLGAAVRQLPVPSRTSGRQKS